MMLIDAWAPAIESRDPRRCRGGCANRLALTGPWHKSLSDCRRLRQGLRAGAPSNILNRLGLRDPGFYQEYNLAFAQAYGKQNGVAPTVDLSRNGGSSKQARAVIYGLETDVVAMNQETDIDDLFGGRMPRKSRTLPTEDL